MIEGKTKILTESPDDPNLLLMHTKNSLTANDGETQRNFSAKIGEFKTIHNCGVMELLKKHHVPVAYVNSHWYEGVADSVHKSISVVNKCRMIPLECVTRRQPYGSYIKRHPTTSFDVRFDPLLIEFFHKYTVVTPCTIHRNQMAINENYRLIPEDKAREWYMEKGKWNHQVYTDPLVKMMPPEGGTATATYANWWNNWRWELHPAKFPMNIDQPLMTISSPISRQAVMEIAGLARKVFTILEAAWKQHDIDLIDLKIEVGYQEKDNQLVVADVIDNDSWRIWPHGDPKNQLDKQSFREGEEDDAVVEKYRLVSEYIKKW